MEPIEIQDLTEELFRPYGWLVGMHPPNAALRTAYLSPETDFWEDHYFDVGIRGDAQVLWVNYRNTEKEIAALESHRLTEQMVVPITGPIIQIVATKPDAESLCAFHVKPGQAICMRRECWHTTRVKEGEVRCLMITRQSTTDDLINHLNTDSNLRESALVRLEKSRHLAGSVPAR